METDNVQGDVIFRRSPKDNRYHLAQPWKLDRQQVIELLDALSEAAGITQEIGDSLRTLVEWCVKRQLDNILRYLSSSEVTITHSYFSVEENKCKVHRGGAYSPRGWMSNGIDEEFGDSLFSGIITAAKSVYDESRKIDETVLKFSDVKQKMDAPGY